eukprot:gene19359-26417_t
MAALLSDINQAGLGRGLQFELFKPGQVVVRDYYAELPIDIKVSGNYHDIGAFASDMANLPRIVTLNNMALTAGKDGNLTLDAVAKTFRYLDPDEVAAQRKAAADKKKLSCEPSSKLSCRLPCTRQALALAGLLALAGCGDSDVQEVRDWMKQVDSQAVV